MKYGLLHSKEGSWVHLLPCIVDSVVSVVGMVSDDTVSGEWRAIPPARFIGFDQGTAIVIICNHKTRIDFSL